MAQESIKCPKCGELIPLTEALSHDIEERTRQKYLQALDKEKAALRSQLAEKDKSLATKIEAERQALVQRELEIEQRFKEQRKLLETKLQKEAKEAVDVELADLKAQADAARARLKVAQDNEVELRKRQHLLEEKERSLELDMARKLDEERAKIEHALFVRLEEQHKLKDAEKEKKLTDALKQIEDLKRKMEQGSQQTQGEVLELELEAAFRREFPFDEIEPVSKGVRGGDILQTVRTQSGRVCGKILWETKRAKNWTESWLLKLKDDQREAKADLSVLVSETLPPGFHHFRQIQDVWVTDIPSALSLALALRMVLIQVATAREIESSKDDKKELIYRYVTGSEFRNKVTAIIEAFRTMQEDLDAEKRAMQRIWDKRQKQIERIVSNTAGMYGDLEGLAGNALQAIKPLELPVDDTKEE